MSLRVAVAVLPVALSIVLTFAASRLLPTPSGLRSVVVQWAVLSLLSTGLLLGLRRVARRVLPLATMAGLALVFPDRVPSRMRMALRRGSVTDLDARVHRARMAGANGDETDAAGGLLELVGDLSSHDRSTRGHSERVRGLSQLIAEEMGLSAEDRDLLNWSALLHDVGKIDVSREILNKSGPLTDEDWTELRTHPGAGARLVRPLEGWLGPWLAAVGQHHERWDGAGYPQGLAGEDIALPARIVAVADAFDAMTNVGADGRRLNPDQARAELAWSAGRQFDPTVVRAFLAIGMTKLRAAMGPLSWLANLPIVGRIPLTPAISGVVGSGIAAASLFTGGVGTQAEAVPEAGAPPVVIEAPPDTVTEVEPPPTSAPVASAPEPPAPEPPLGPEPPPEEPPLPGPGPTAPAAPSYSLTLDEDTTVDLDLGDPDGMSLVDGVDHGVLAATGPGSVRYKPGPDFNGGDGFTYQRCAGGLCNVGVVTITVLPVNDDPVAEPDLSFGLEDGGPFDLDVLGNDTDIDGGVLSVSAAYSPVGGTVAILPSGLVRFTPSPNFNGTASFGYRVADGRGGTDNGAALVGVIPVNDPPSFAAGPDHNAPEDGGVQLVSGWVTGIAPGPADESGQSVTFIVTADDPALFAVQPAVAPDGTLTYKPAADANGTATITVTAKDNGGTANGGIDTSPGQIADITITAVPDAPVAADEVYGTDEEVTLNEPAVAGLLANDSDADGDPLTVNTTPVTPPTGGAVTLYADGSFDYVPNPDFFGIDSFVYEIDDGSGLTDTATATILVTGQPDAPAAVDDAYGILEEVTLNEPAITGLLANDGDVDGDPLTVNTTPATPPTDGALTLYGDGSFDYDPDPDFVGIDTFVYEIDDGTGRTDSATVTITVAGVNDAPSFVVGADVVVLEDAGAQSVSGWVTAISAGPADESGQSVSFAVVADDPTLFSTQPAVAPDGTLTYTPAVDAVGTATITVTAQDDGGTANGGIDTSPGQTADITITPVNDDPVAADDPDGGDDPNDFRTVLLADLFIPAAALLDNDTDPELDTLAVAVTGPTGTAQGSVQCDATGCTYTPNGSYLGLDTFVYTVSDGNGGTDTATVTVNVVDYVASPHQGAVVINEVLANGVEDVVLGTDEFIELHNTTGAPVDISGWTVTDNNLIAADLDPLGGFEYQIPPGSVIPGGGYAVMWLGSDQRAVAPGYTNVVGGGVLEFYGNFWEFLSPPGDDPTLYDDRYQIVDHVAWGSTTASNRNVPPPASMGVWDTPPNNEPNLEVTVPGPSISLTPDGSFTADSYCWERTTSFTASCPGALPTIDTDTYPGRTTSVGRFNNGPAPPEAHDDVYGTLEEVTLNVPAVSGLLANDTDPNLDPLTVNTTPITPPSDGALTLYADGAFDYVPDPDWNGVDSFTYEIDDGTGRTDTAIVTISVTAVNDPPSFTAGADEIVLEDPGAQSVPGWATGISVGPANEAGQTITFSVVSDDPSLFAAQPAVSPTGTLAYTPAADANGTATVTITAQDDGGTANGGVDTSPGQVAEITITAVNDPPSLLAGADEVVLEDSGAQTVPGWATAISPGPPDEAGQSVTFSVTADDPTLFSIQPALAPTGTLTYTPAADANGTATLTVTARDDGGTANGGNDTSAGQTADITVTPVPDPPVAGDDAYGTDEDVVLNEPALTGLLADDDDVDGDPLTVNTTPVTPPTDGSLTLYADGSFDYDPDQAFNGTDSFVYEIDDGTGRTDTATVTITVAAVPDAPSAADDAYVTDQDVTLNEPALTGVLANDDDEDGDPLTLNTTPVTPPTDGGLTLYADGSFDYDPDIGFSGVDTFVYEIDDGTGRTDTATVTITVSSAVLPGGYYLGDSGPTSEWFDLVASPLPPAVPVPDYDGDGKPGLTITKSRGHENESDPQKYQEWSYAPPTALELTGPISLDLWSRVADPVGGDVHVKIRVHDCADDNTDCQQLLYANYHVDDWDDGTGNFVFRDVALGTLDTTILPGRMLRLKVMFDHEDVWVAMTEAHPSFLDWTEGPRPPVANDDGPIVLDEDTGPVNIDVLANDGDATLDPATVTVVTGPTIGTATPQLDGTIDYDADPDSNGPDSFVYEVCDTTAACSPATVTITVNPVADAPQAADDFYTVAQDTQLSVPQATGVLANDADADGDDIEVNQTPISGPANGTLDLKSKDGDFDYDPDPGFNGIDSFVYEIGDGTGLTDTATVFITVAAGAEVATGDWHTCARRGDGSVWCWGSNWSGQLGDGGTADSTTPVQVVGPGGSGTLSGALAVTAGNEHSCAALTDGSVWCWGDNFKGQLGDGGTAASTTPVQVVGPGGSGALSAARAVTAGKWYTCAALTDGSAWCWGRNGSGQLGDGTTVDSSAPVEVVGPGGTGILAGIADLAAGDSHACAADSGGQAFCWGANGSGQIGDGTTGGTRPAPAQVVGPGGAGFLTGALRLDASEAHTCAADSGGQAFCWGANGSGQIGDGTTGGTRPAPVQVLGPGGTGVLGSVSDVGLAKGSSCARLVGSSAWCWGSDEKGELGDGAPKADSPTPVQVAGPGGLGNLTGVVGLSEPGGKGRHTCAALADGAVWCWGWNGDGQLGDGTTGDREFPVQALP